MITITGVVYHVALGQLLDLDGVHQLGNQLVHTVVPLLALIGSLVFGPCGQTSRGVACLSVLYPFCWLVFTPIRGAVIGWYPYPFIDVTQLGYGKAVVNCFWVSLLLFGLAAGAIILDARFGPSPHSFSPAGMPSEARALTIDQLSDGRAERSGASADTGELLREAGLSTT